MVSLIILFTASMIACTLSANLALWFTKLSMQPAFIAARRSPGRRMTMKYAAGSFALLALCAFGGVCTSLVQIFSA
jgi:hypothetical protein